MPITGNTEKIVQSFRQGVFLGGHRHILVTPIPPQKKIGAYAEHQLSATGNMWYNDRVV